jgi:hypothetical protein
MLPVRQTLLLTLRTLVKKRIHIREFLDEDDGDEILYRHGSEPIHAGASLSLGVRLATSNKGVTMCAVLTPLSAHMDLFHI